MTTMKTQTSTTLTLRNCNRLTERSTSGTIDYALLVPKATADPLPA